MRAEDAFQISAVQWLRLALPPGWIVQHTPNKPRSRQSGALEKRMGALAGWPDLGLYGPSHRVIFLELKAGTKTSAAQDDMHVRLGSCGFDVFVCRTFPEIAAALVECGVLELDELPAALRSGDAGGAGGAVPPAKLTRTGEPDMPKKTECPYTDEQIIEAVRKANSGASGYKNDTSGVLDVLDMMQQFADRVRDHRTSVMNRLDTLANAGRLVRHATGSGRGTRYAWSVSSTVAAAA